MQKSESATLSHRPSEAQRPPQGRLARLLRGLTLSVAGSLLVAVAAAGVSRGADRADSDDQSLMLLAFGDSLVHGYGLADGETFPDQLEAALKALGRDVDVINAGNSGDTTAAGRARLDWALADRPDAVLLELGANDGLRGLDPAETYANLDAVLARLKTEGLPVLLAGMLAPRNFGNDYAEEFDEVFPRLARTHEVSLYPFFLEGVATVPSLNQADGIHPNAEGVAVIVDLILPFVIELIDTAAASGTPGGG